MARCSAAGRGSCAKDSAGGGVLGDAEPSERRLCTSTPCCCAQSESDDEGVSGEGVEAVSVEVVFVEAVFVEAVSVEGLVEFVEGLEELVEGEVESG